MSRIGKKPVYIPEGVDVKVDNDILTIKGKLGELSLDLKPLMNIIIEDNVLTVKPLSQEEFLDKKKKSKYGLTRALINNMVIGVSKGFLKELSVVGTGYKAEIKGREIILKVGYSHDVIFKIPEGINVNVSEGTSIKISGIDKQLVGEFAAKLYLSKKPNPYSGKGIRYKDKPVRRKERKAGV